MKANVLALYLPQYHPTPDNDLWWGEGFTEWTNVAKAKKLYRNHYQPRIPANLGFYDLRLPEVREKQAEMARRAIGTPVQRSGSEWQTGFPVLYLLGKYLVGVETME